MRGAPALRNKFYDALGIIHADAGSTVSLDCEFCVFVDHPRGCGEHTVWIILIFLKAGSSPRMRGAHETVVSRILILRIIPADAGSTKTGYGTDCAPQDHPRGCGEHSAITYARRYSLGSSPRMRGALQRQRAKPTGAGIIPADAGSTL